MQSFSNRLIALRKERGLTQAELAKLTHLQRSTLSGYETEGKEPTFETLCALASYFGVTTDYLLGISSARTHNDAVFVNDSHNFAACYEQLPAHIKATIAASFDSSYLILSRDMKMRKQERLAIYAELFDLIQRSRTSIRNSIEGSDSKDALFLSNLMTEQSNFKNEVSVLLDKLMQADMGVAQKGSHASSAKSAI